MVVSFMALPLSFADAVGSKGFIRIFSA